MDEKDQNKPVVKKTKFTYDPDSLDIAEFKIVFDHLHWKLLCKQAQDFSTSPSHLLAMVIEKYLINTGYLDLKAPSSEGFPVSVTLRDLRTNPNNLFNFIPNPLLPDPQPSADPYNVDQKDIDLGDFI